MEQPSHDAVEEIVKAFKGLFSVREIDRLRDILTSYCLENVLVAYDLEEHRRSIRLVVKDDDEYQLVEIYHLYGGWICDALVSKNVDEVIQRIMK